MKAVSVKGEIDNHRKNTFENIPTGLTHFENGDVLLSKNKPDRKTEKKYRKTDRNT